MDLQGRMCENENEVQDLLYQFNEEIVPGIEARWGDHTALQERFTSSCPLIKNQVWNALQRGNYDRIHALLSTGRAVSQPRCRCYISIGAPRSGKTQFIRNIYGRIPVFQDNETLTYQGELSQSMRDFLACNLSHGQDLAIDGCNLHVLQRQQVADFARQYETEIHYLFFERSLPDLLQANISYANPLDPQQLKKAYALLLKPHPWEAHSLQIV